MTSLYWASATATSTGYGDVHAYTIAEKVYSIGAMIVGKNIKNSVWGLNIMMRSKYYMPPSLNVNILDWFDNTPICYILFYAL